MTLEAPRIVETAEQLTASLPLCVSWSEMCQVMGPGLAELRAVVAAQEITVTGPWFARHFRMPTDTFDFEICLPVAGSIAAAGRVKPGLLPAATVAQTVHCGDYGGLGKSWGELGAWIAAQGHVAGPGLLERYLVGPESGPDSAGFRTELNRPLVSVKA